VTFRVRVPVTTWFKDAVDCWLTAAGITTGPIFRAINKAKGVGTSGYRQR